MPKITILGAGVVGMSIASQLPKGYDIKIVGEFLPGDDMNPHYTSQWAGAIWLGTHNAPAREQKMQLEGLSGLWEIAERHPESSVRKITMTEIVDYGSPDDVWYRKHCPDLELMPKSELPKGASYGLRYSTVIVTPPVFLPWMRKVLEARGVVFERMHVKALADLKGMGHDVLINATNVGSMSLLDVQEKNLVPVKQQNIRIRKGNYNQLYIRRGLNGYYSTAFARHDGTIYIGGIKTEGKIDFETKTELRDLIFRRQHENQPRVFPSPNLADYDFITDHTGVFFYRAQKDGGVRVEKEVVQGQNVVHAYGQEAGGYVYSFGMAREVARLVDDFVLQTPRSNL